MQRDDWNSLHVDSTNLVAVDVKKTPLSGVAEKCLIPAAVVRNSSHSDAKVSIYRYDEKDQPTPINVDHYRALTNLKSYPNIDEIIRAASTSLDANLERFMEDNVFLVKEEKEDDHWLPSLPSSVIAVIEINHSST
jgi:hypothetical protein